MIDILVYLFENYSDFPSYPAQGILARKLGAVGFEEQEISAALGWLEELKGSQAFSQDCGYRSTRVYSFDERSKLSHESLRFILFLESGNLITPVQRELIIDRAMTLEDSPVPLDRFKIIVLMVLWSSEARLEPLIVEELLYSNDPQLLH